MTQRGLDESRANGVKDELIRVVSSRCQSWCWLWIWVWNPEMNMLLLFGFNNMIYIVQRRSQA